MRPSHWLQSMLQKIYDEAIKAMSGVMDTRNMYIALYNEETDLIEFPLAYEKDQLVPERVKVAGTPWGPRRLGERNSLTEWIIRHKRPLLIEKDFEIWVKTQEDIATVPNGTKCWLSAPMLLRDRVVGVIGLQNFEEEWIYDHHHRDLLMTIASQAATAIENARLFEAERRSAEQRKERLKILQEVTQRMVEAGLEPDVVLELVAQAASDISHSDLTSIYRYDPNAAKFTGGVRVYRGKGVESVDDAELPNPDGVSAQIAEAQLPIFVDDVAKNPEATDFAKRHQIQSFAGLPLSIGGNQGISTTVAVLFVNFEQPHFFSEDEQEILRHLANQAAVAIAYAGVQEAALANEQLVALGTAAATLQHRLGNTINVILPAVARLRLRVGDETSSLDILDTIERNTIFATEVIRRMQSSLIQEDFVRTNINSLLREAIEKCMQDTDRFSDIRLMSNLPDLVKDSVVSTSATPQQITIMADLDEDFPDTYAKSGQMTEVFRVLIENAIKAIYPQSGLVTVTSRLKNDRLRRYVEITVSDTGSGIDDKKREKLFKQPVPDRKFGQGAGLGLWLSNIIVRSHQGNIALHNTKLDEGSTFLVRLPILSRSPRP